MAALPSRPRSGLRPSPWRRRGLFFPFQKLRKSKEERFYNRDYYFAHFPHSIRGLEPGASVEFLGFKVGEVVDMKLELDVDQVQFLTPVLFYVEPERVNVRGEHG